VSAPAGTSAPFGVMHAVLWMSTAFFWMLLGALLLGAVRQEALQDMVSLGGLSAVVFLLTSALLTSRHPGGDTLREALGFRATAVLLLPLAFVGGALAQVPAEGVVHLESLVVPGVDEAMAERANLLVPHGSLHGVLLVLVLALLVPIAEEAFFRGAVYGALRRAQHPGWQAGLISGLGFTLSHYDPTMLLPIALVAAYLTFLRIVSGSLWASLFAHVGFNLVTMLSVVLRVPEDAIDVLSLRWQLGAGLGIALSIALALWLSRAEAARSSRSEEATPVDA
jgi:membrane protease YdiL (CAAX protease family)